PLQEPDRAQDLAAMVVLDGRAEEARARGAALGARPVPPRIAAHVRDRIARGSAGLEHLPPDLVGTSAATVGVPGRARHRRGDRAGLVLRMRLPRAHAIDRRARYVVLVRALAVRNDRLA